VTKDDLPILKFIAKDLGPENLGIPAMFKAAHPRKNGHWTVFMQDDLKKIMRRLLRDGLAVESPGPAWRHWLETNRLGPCPWS
jgi:hypothetical protein